MQYRGICKRISTAHQAGCDNDTSKVRAFLIMGQGVITGVSSLDDLYVEEKEGRAITWEMLKSM